MPNIFSYTYTYDTASRLSSVGSGTRLANYTYLPNSPLVEQTTFKDGATVRMVTTRKYDSLNRLTSIGSGTSASATPHTAYNDAYNAANQRIQTTQHDTSYWVYEYDALGQVISGKRFWADGTLVAGQQFEYRFDDIGNRTQTQTGGDSSGQNLRVASYTANGLNQYTSRDVPRFIEVQGIAETNSTITVNGSSTDVYRKGEYFRKELDLTGNNASVWQGLTIAASGGSPAATGNRFLQAHPEGITYDDDGNTLTDGRWTYVWDAENRLTSLTSLANTPTGSKFQLSFVYDSLGRRIQKTVATNNGTAYVTVSTNRFLYDGWNVTAQLEGSTGFGARLYLWGLDLSGSEQGAGGVGGLVAQGPASSGLDRFVAYDGNGNVTGMTSATDGMLTARYEYGPFGELQRASGADWQKNPFRFSTKWQDDESEFLYYGYRYYDANRGRWPSRDPIEELTILAVSLDGGADDTFTELQERLTSANTANLYAFCLNDGVSRWDLLGLVPRGETFWEQYPNYNGYTAPAVWDLIGGNLGPQEKGKDSDTCAARVSVALNKIPGEQMKTSPRDYINTVRRGQVGVAGNYIVNARKMGDYLTQHWGTASQCSETAAYYFVSQAKTIDALRKEITDTLKKCACTQDYYAVVVYTTPAGTTYSGHVGVVTASYSNPYTPPANAASSRVWLLPPTKNPPPPKP